MNNETNIIPAPSAGKPMRGGSLEELVQRFLSEQQVRKNSKASYYKSLKQYFWWIADKNLHLRDITRAEIIQWKDELSSPDRKPKRLSPSTVGTYLAAVRIFYKWCEGHKLYPNVADNIRSPKVEDTFKKQAMTAEQCSRLLEYFKTQPLRNYAFVNLMLRTGLRTIEVIRMDTADITYMSGKRVLMVQGKGKDTKNKFVKLSDKAFEPIAEYLKSKGKTYAGAVFTSQSDRNVGERLTTHSISRIVKEGFREIGIDNKFYTAHTLRHTAATLMLRAGAGMERVQHVLRHAKIDTTQGYTKTFDDERRLVDSPEDLLDGVF